MAFLSITGQVAAHLRRELLEGRWVGTMPGVSRLSKELGVSRKTVEGALGQLEREGLLVSQGRGRSRRVVPKLAGKPGSALKVALLEYDPAARMEPYMIDLNHRLQDTGCRLVESLTTLTEMGMNVDRVGRLVGQTQADAWIVCSASKPVLEWFLGEGLPTFAFFGRRRSLEIAGAGPDHEKARREMIRRLIELGHRRIVTLVHQSQRDSGPSAVNRAKLEEMEAHGIPTGSYNLPEWDDTEEGFHQLLDELFRVTPPTALILDEPFHFHAAKEHLAQRGILAPADISLICSDPDPTFVWCRPSVAHVRWNESDMVRQTLRWISNIAQGKDDRSQVLTKAEFVEGGTVGPVPA